MKRLRMLLALSLLAVILPACAFSVREVSYGFLRRSRADPDPPPPAPAPVYVYQTPTTCEQRGAKTCADFLVEAWVCSGDATDPEIVEALRRAGVVRDEAVALIGRQRLKGCADAPRLSGR